MVRFRRVAMMSMILVILPTQNASTFGSPADTTTEAVQKTIESANKAIESAEKAIEAANKAIEVANTATNAATIAQDAAKQAGESAKAAAAPVESLHGIQKAINELRQAVQAKTEVSTPSMQNTAGASRDAGHLALDSAMEELRDLEEKKKKLIELRSQIDGFLKPPNIDQQSNRDAVRQSGNNDSWETFKQIQQLKERIERLEIRLGVPRSELTPAEMELQSVISEVIRPMDAEVEFSSSAVTSGYQTASLFITMPNVPNGLGLFVNGTQVQLQAGSVQHVELEFRTAPSVCEVRIQAVNSMIPVNFDTPHKRFTVEPGRKYLVDHSELKASLSPFAVQAVVAPQSLSAQ